MTITIENAFGRTVEMQTNVNLKEPVTESVEDEAPRDIKNRMKEFELAYKNDPVIYNSINDLVRIVMHPDHSLEGSNKNTFNDFLKNVGFRGSTTHWREILEKIFKYQMIYGNAYLELLRDDDGNIADIDIIDPKTMDFARNSRDEIVVDDFNRPVGFVHHVPNSHVGLKQVDPVPDEVQLHGDDLFLKPERVVHFRMNSVGVGNFGIGLVEPIYKVTQYKQNLEQQLAQSALKHGTGILSATFGDINHQPTKENMNNILSKLAEANTNKGLVMPYYSNVEFLEAQNAEQFLSYLRYYIEQQIAGMGIPQPFGTGTGEQTNRATLGRQEHIMKMSLKHLVKNTTATIENQIFRVIADERNLGDFPRFRWEELALEELDAFAMRMERYARTNLITPTEEVRNHILRKEGLK